VKKIVMNREEEIFNEIKKSLKVFVIEDEDFG
jgi:hypothetical protein